MIPWRCGEMCERYESIAATAARASTAYGGGTSRS
jgi:hypothetical protein